MLLGASKFTNITKSVVRNLPLNPNQLKRYIADKCCPTQAPKKSKDTAADSTKNDAFTPLDFLPITVYRPLDDPKEVFGPGAHKCKEYKNPEYFACHRFSFYELQIATLELAKNPKGGLLYEAEESDEDKKAEEECVGNDGEVEVAVTECKRHDTDKKD
uniref:Uncharacterized protein n=1 Tax=Ceratitis capitata TaxID=7213 RepID=W8CCM9_CERCA